MSDGPAGKASRGSWRFAIRRGFVAFAIVLGFGEALAAAVWLLGGTGLSLGGALALGWLEVGAFHHVAVRLEIRDLVTPAASSITVTIGVALLAATTAAVWLLVRAGRAVADAARGSALVRAARGATIAIGYALPFAALAPLVDVETARPSAAAASGVFRLSLVWWQALAFPLVLAATAGALGGLRSALDAIADTDRRRERIEAAVAAAGHMLVASFALVVAALFVGGVVQPAGPLALATPTTARYLRATFDRPSVGVLLLGHHLALAPAEAAWVLVPAMGGCDRVWGSVDADILCYGRFPVSVGSTLTPISSTEAIRLPLGESRFGRAPSGYLLFLLVPAIATILGGRRAARDATTDREAMVAAALAGVAFAVAVVIVCLLSQLTIGYRSSVAGDVTSGWLLVGPDPVSALGLGLGWGVAGGIAGAWVSRRRSRRRSRE